METDQMLKQFLPNSYINHNIKETLLLQLISSEPISILLIGDPGTGKTDILKSIAQLKAEYYDCNPSTKLTKADFLCLNKIDRLTDQYDIVDLVNSGTSILAAACPKYGRFDPYDLIAKQIDLPPTLLNSFDLIFVMKDFPNPEKDTEVASFILRGEKIDNPKEWQEKLQEYNNKEVQTMTDEAIEELTKYYVFMRNSDEEEGIKTIPITARQLITLAKLSKAAAKLRFSNTVSRNDAITAIRLVDFCLNEIVKDKETGQLDINRLYKRKAKEE